MKKKLLALACALTLTFGCATPVMAVVSPTATPTKTTSTTSPKTGESNAAVYAIAAALLATGTAVVSKKKLTEA